LHTTIKYVQANNFSSGFAWVKLGNEYFYIDKNGKKTNKNCYCYDDKSMIF